MVLISANHQQLPLYTFGPFMRPALFLLSEVDGAHSVLTMLDIMKNASPDCRLGDKVKRKKLGSDFDHYGVISGVWPLRVVHNVKGRGVREVPFEEFAAGKAVKIVGRAPEGYGKRVAERARSLIGRPYDFLFFNCEHMANLACRGTSTSGQIAGGMMMAGTLGFFAWALKNGGTTYDPVVDRYRDSRGRFC